MRFYWNRSSIFVNNRARKFDRSSLKPLIIGFTYRTIIYKWLNAWLKCCITRLFCNYTPVKSKNIKQFIAISCLESTMLKIIRYCEGGSQSRIKSMVNRKPSIVQISCIFWHSRNYKNWKFCWNLMGNLLGIWCRYIQVGQQYQRCNGTSDDASL